MKFKNTEYLKSAMLGLIVADALGMPYEFRVRDTFKVTGMVGYGAHMQPDTIAGGLAGIYYGIGGEKGIPEKWIDALARKDWIEEMPDKAVES